MSNNNLFDACERGDGKFIQKLFDLHKIHFAHNFNEITIACFNRHEDIVIFLLKNFKVADKSLKVIFEMACQRECMNVIKYLINEKKHILKSHDISRYMNFALANRKIDVATYLYNEFYSIDELAMMRNTQVFSVCAFNANGKCEIIIDWLIEKKFINEKNFKTYHNNISYHNHCLCTNIIDKMFDDSIQPTKIYIEPNCPICAEQLNDNHTLKCGHIYHKKCIINWCKINNSCPICRCKC